MMQPSQRRQATHVDVPGGPKFHPHGPHLRIVGERSEAEVQKRIADLLQKIESHTATVGSWRVSSK